MASKFHNLIAKINFYHEAVNKKDAAFKRLPNGKVMIVRAASEHETIDLSKLDELSYSAIIRVLRKENSESVTKDFLNIYKQIFDALVMKGVEDPGTKAMPVTLMIFSKLYEIKLSKSKHIDSNDVDVVDQARDDQIDHEVNMQSFAPYLDMEPRQDPIYENGPVLKNLHDLENGAGFVII